MSEESVTETAASSSPGRPKQARKLSFFGRIALFIRQVIGELRKVVTPTRQELLTYTIVVLAFVAVVMVIVFALDFVFGLGVGWVFGGESADR